MKIQKLIAFILLFSAQCIYGQNQYVLDLKSEPWNIKTSLYYFSDVLDERSDRVNAGQVLNNGKSQKAVFKISLEADLKKLILESIKQDTSGIPLVISFDKLSLKETGTLANHTATLDFSINIYRVTKEKRYLVYQVNGRPEMSIRGDYPLVHEKNISASLKSALEGFNDWVIKNPNQSTLAKNVKVTFDTKKLSAENSDTLTWKEEYKLRWSDFKGAPLSNSFMAQSNCIFSYSAVPNVKEGTMELVIFLNACFDRKTSWVLRDKHTDELLAHEQLHFDICELYIRRLKNKISTFALDPLEFDIQVNKLFDEGWNEYQKQQQVYDEETEHGIVEAIQNKWENEINIQLRNISLMEF